MKIQRNILFALTFLLCVNAFSQSSADAKKVLDKTAKVVRQRGGAAANFSITGGDMGRTSGSIVIKGNKFKAVTPETTIGSMVNAVGIYEKHQRGECFYSKRGETPFYEPIRFYYYV